MSLILPRRSFIAGLASAIAAPAIVRAPGLMRVWPVAPRRRPQTEISFMGRPIVAGDLVAGQLVSLAFNGVGWEVLAR